MKKITRYRQTNDDYHGGLLEEDDNGQWVKYEDIKDRPKPKTNNDCGNCLYKLECSFSPIATSWVKANHCMHFKNCYDVSVPVKPKPKTEALLKQGIKSLTNRVIDLESAIKKALQVPIPIKARIVLKEIFHAKLAQIEGKEE